MTTKKGTQPSGKARPPAGGKPYRYAGKKWWTGEFRLEEGEPRFERYFSREYHRAHHGGDPRNLVPDEALLTPTRASQTLLQDPALAELTAVFNRWAQDMTAWAKAVREDILAIEKHLGMPHGDPGDPPPVPWK